MKEGFKRLTMRPEATIKEAMRIIDDGAIKMALITDAAGVLLGTVTDGDIRRGILRGLSVDEPVRTVMKEDCITAPADEEAILETLLNTDVIAVPVIDEKRVVTAVMLREGNRAVPYGADATPRHLRRVLVIGGGGYIGSVLVRQLLEKGYGVTVLDKFLYGRESLEGLEDGALRILTGDTRHVEDITRAAQDADAVVHLAELVGDPACALDPQRTIEMNYLATLLVAEVCKHQQINRLVYMSSCSVYGASQQDELLTEQSPLAPVSLYARLKIAAERALKELADSNFRPTILRLSTVFGPSPRPRFDLVVNLLTAKALREGKITIFGGDQWRPNVHVADVAETIVHVLEAPLEAVGGEVFNVGADENNHTIEEIGRLVKQHVPTAALLIDEQSVDRRDYRVSFEKLKTTLGFTPRRSVSEGIKEISSFLTTHPELDYTDARFSNIKFLKEHPTE